jgi:hypothetical protein
VHLFILSLVRFIYLLLVTCYEIMRYFVMRKNYFTYVLQFKQVIFEITYILIPLLHIHQMPVTRGGSHTGPDGNDSTNTNGGSGNGPTPPPPPPPMTIEQMMTMQTQHITCLA